MIRRFFYTLKQAFIQVFRNKAMSLASIFAITAMLMIKSDLIKQQIEVGKIVEEQKKIREEKQQEENKEKEEKKKQDKEKKEKEKENNKEEGTPEGSKA